MQAVNGHLKMSFFGHSKMLVFDHLKCRFLVQTYLIVGMTACLLSL
jgi:hypothetical protein